MNTSGPYQIQARYTSGQLQAQGHTGDVMILGLCYHQVDAIIDVNLGDDNADTYKYKTMTSPLVRWENIKKGNHGKHCHDQHKHFSPFVLSVDVILGR